MIGPSPDWGVGMSNVNLCVDGYWTHFTEPAYPYDAGSASGNTYLAYFTRGVTSEPISQITIDTAPIGDDGTKVLANAEQTKVLPMGIFLMEPLTPCEDDPEPFYCGPQPFTWYSTESGPATEFGRRKMSNARK